MYATPPKRDARIRLRAVTLMELVVSSTVTTLIMAGFASAILLATHAIPDAHGPLGAVIDAAEIVDEIAAELRYALSFTSASANVVEFTVPDRDTDDAPETIRYEWSGTPGDPLIRRYNGGTAVNVADDVHEFQLGYDLRTATAEGPPEEEEGVERLLVAYEPTTNLEDFSIDASAWPGECFRPVLPADSTSWRVTRVKFQAKVRDDDDGVTMVQLRSPTESGLPSDTVLQEVAMYESALTDDYLWHEFSLDVPGVSPSEGLCLVLEFLSADHHSCKVLFQGADSVLVGAAFVETDDGGAAWIKDSSQALLLYVYGTVTTAGEPTVVEVNHATGVHISLRIGGDAASRVDAAAQTLNVPEVIGP